MLDPARCSHQGNTVVLDQNCGPNHSAVQVWKPETKEYKDCIRLFLHFWQASKFLFI